VRRRFNRLLRFQQPQLLEFLDGRGNVRFNGTLICAELGGELGCDLGDTVLSVAAIPDEAGRLIELVDLVGLSIQDDSFAVDNPLLQV